MFNDLFIAAGTFGSDGYGKDVDFNLLPEDLGGVVLKTTTLKPRAGIPEPNVLLRDDGSIINSIGLKNPGIENIVVSEQLKRPAYLSLYAEEYAEWEELIDKANKVPNISGLELNLSCPNLGEFFIKDYMPSRNVSHTVATTMHVLEKTSLPVWVKLAPNPLELYKMVASLRKNARDIAGIILSNTTMAMDPNLLDMLGGLSGPPLRPITMRLVYLAHKQIPELKITACGGISTKEHIRQYKLAGASRFQIGTAFYRNDFRIPDSLI